MLCFFLRTEGTSNVENPFIFPLAIVALFLCGAKAWGQGIVIAVLAPYVASQTTFIALVLFSGATFLYGSLISSQGK